MSAFSFNPFTGTFDKVVREWTRFAGIVPAGQTVVVDTVPLADLIGSKYVVALSNETETNGNFLELNVLNLTSNLKSNVFSKLKGTLDTEIDAIINGSNMEVSVKNNEVFNVNYNVLRTLFN